MRDVPTVIVPALTPVDDGLIQTAAAHAYAQRAASTWIDAWLLSGSTTRGDLLTVAQRADLIDLWRQHVPADRLIACCWTADDVTAATERGVAAMVVLRDLADQRAALDFLAGLPTGTYIYSHPMYTPTVFDAEMAAAAAAEKVLPAGGKLAKVGLDEVAAIRAAAGPGFQLWDGRCRHIAASTEAGAAGVIVTPLSHIPDPFPGRGLPGLQEAVDAHQAAIDALPDRQARTALLLQAAFGDQPGRLGGRDGAGVDDQVRTV